MENKLYIEFVSDDPRNRGYFIPVDKLKGFINANVGNIMYHSYFLYDQSVIEHVEKYETLKGYGGPRYHYKTILDIDAEDDIPGAAETALAIREYLIDYHELAQNNVQLWFSGGKGFHIHLPNPFGFEGGPDLPATLKHTLHETFERWEDHLDLMPTSPTGIIRCPWSGHTSGNLKVPMEPRQVRAIAQQVLAPESMAGPDTYSEQFEVIAEGMDTDDDHRMQRCIATGARNKNHHQLNDMDRPNSVVTCMQKLLLRGPVKGRRHKDSLRLVSNWRRQGIPASYSAMMLLDWLGDTIGDESEADEFRKIVRDVYQQSYAYSCKDEVMAEFCDSKCIFFKNKDYILEVSSNENMMREYKNYLSNVISNGVDIGQMFGFDLTYKFLPGELVIITGDTGMGKSAFVQTILERAGQTALYLNMEMHEALLYRRFLQIQYQMDKHEINYHIKEGADFSGSLEWLNILSTSPEVGDLDRLIAQKDYQIVVVDTSDGIRCDENEYQRLGMIINTLREIAQNRNILIILVHHIKKMGSFRTKIELDDLSGNRANVTKMDHVFVVEGSENKRWLRSLKTRDGDKVTLPFIFEFKTMTFKRNDNHDRSFSGGRPAGLSLGGS